MSNDKENTIKKAVEFLVGVVVLGLFSLMATVPLHLSWNLVLSESLHISPISFLQSFLLSITLFMFAFFFSLIHVIMSDDRYEPDTDRKASSEISGDKQIL